MKDSELIEELISSYCVHRYSRYPKFLKSKAYMNQYDPSGDELYDAAKDWFERNDPKKVYDGL